MMQGRQPIPSQAVLGKSWNLIVKYFMNYSMNYSDIMHMFYLFAYIPLHFLIFKNETIVIIRKMS